MTPLFFLIAMLVLLAGSLGGAFVYPRRAMRLLSCGWCWLANRSVLAVLATAMLSTLACVALAHRGPWHSPGTHDEFGYLLTADTFARGRLTNPTPPFWTHFESIHLILRPSYTSKYPPGQSLFLALGWALFGHPMIGVYLSFILMCSATCWMLQGWLPPRWAFLGGVLSILMLGTTTWANSYWGGAVAALGGALVFGALRRLIAQPGVLSSLAFGLGLAILANTRPYEGLVVSVPAVLVLISLAIRRGYVQSVAFWMRGVVPLVLVLGAAAIWMAWYNCQVTGSPWRMPYQIHDETYSATPTFLWQAPKEALPSFHHVSMYDYYVGHELERFLKKRFLWGFNSSLATKLYIFSRFFVTPLLILPMLVLTKNNRQRWWRFAGAVCILELLALTQTLYLFPHYAAPITALMIGLNVQGLRHMWRWKPWGRQTGKIFVMGVVIVFLIGFVFYCRESTWVTPRAAMEADLERIPGNHLVLVRYGANHQCHDEWVYNSADITSARVVWARDLGLVENQGLLEYFQNRKTWILTVNGPEIARLPYVR